MGRPYLDELKELQTTYQWALQEDIQALTSFAERAVCAPLISVGSGGAYSAAHMMAALHDSADGISKAVTPLELLSSKCPVRDCSIAVLTASGRNTDIRRALWYSANAEPRDVLALCMATHTPLSEIAQEYRYATLVEYAPPYTKDGFLAVNSLLATCVLLARAYAELIQEDPELPDVLSLLPTDELLEQFELQLSAMLAKDTWVVLYGRWGLPAAVDLESKLTEAALGHALLADYRNFGHGRHHWLAKRGDDTGVLMLVTPEDAEIAERTVSCLPDSIPVAQLRSGTCGPGGTLDLLHQVLHAVYVVGYARGIDPGRPGVPDFGRRLYNIKLPVGALRQSRHPLLPDRRSQVSISRKTGSPDVSVLDAEVVRHWLKAYRAFTRRLEGSAFGAVVFDYDGTLCDPRERYTLPSQEIAGELHRLLEAGIVVGIATGRGGSVRECLQKSIPSDHWHQVIIGYYNGSDIGYLHDDEHPNPDGVIHPSLISIQDRLSRHPSLCFGNTYKLYPLQISARRSSSKVWRQAKAAIADAVHRMDGGGIRIVESAHSVDILAPGVSKVRLVRVCEDAAAAAGKPGRALCIGDRGRWPGNDYDLLSQPHALSVDAVSPDPDTCWNLCDAGHRGVQAALDYLRAIDAGSGSVQLSLGRLRAP